MNNYKAVRTAEFLVNEMNKYKEGSDDFYNAFDKACEAVDFANECKMDKSADYEIVKTLTGKYILGQ